ncbi:uncharacterized protein LOC132718602 [Ruditapes philippinarum]|uniref:uncharacterized protein LOC132718602 n=1 Tax=Ruditapes philippinarum TaxID=129788 RepID=UPI00295AEC8E|nr:uncharacterized protein LOC132718602 [Ruditapes philippinarum]
MSSNPDLGHLYHDGNICSVYLKLNVQDQIKTREINAREMKTLDKYSRAMDRAKSVCRINNEWEQNYLRTQLRDIRYKTPSLKKGLRQESQRLKSRRHVPKGGSQLPNIEHNQNVSGSYSTPSYRERQNPVLISSWSVYSNGAPRNRSAPVLGSLDVLREQQEERAENNMLKTKSKSVGLVKKAEQVTKTLHKLYTDAFKRKSKENNTTVLDVLGKESREELEKALFVLRGSHAGDVIEDILNDREYVSKHTVKKSQHNDSSDSSSKSDFDEMINDVFVTQSETKNKRSESFVLNEDDYFKDVFTQDEFSVGSDQRRFYVQQGKRQNPLFPNDTSLSPTSKNMRSGETVLSTDKHVSRGTETDDVAAEVFKRDDAWMMSSTLANASDIDSGPSLRWTDLFKTPELWKQNKKGNTKTSPKALSLVTLTGKRRQTMIKR